MKKVLVTGATGFIGRQCLPLLAARGYEVHAVARHPDTDLPATWHTADLLDTSRVIGLQDRLAADSLLHLAWYTEPGAYWTSPLNDVWVDASEHLVRSFVRRGGRRVVVAGTCAEYDWSQGICREGAALHPATPYGRAKAALHARLHCLDTCQHFSLGWARIFFTFGPNERTGRLLPSLIRSLLAGQPFRSTSGEQMRDYLYGPEVAAALAGFLDSDVQGPVNIASGQPVAVKDIVLKVARLLQAESLAELGALPERAEPPAVWADVSRLAKEVGYVPTTSLDEGLRKTVEWWLSQLAEGMG